MTRRMLALLLAAWLPVSASAAVTAYDPAALARLVDDYVKELNEVAKDQTLASIAQQQYYAGLIGLQVAKLEPEDFNKFSLDLVGRYVARPEERKAVGTFIKGMKKAISADLEHTEMIRSGPTESIVKGMTWYGTALLALTVVAGRGVRMAAPYKYFSPIRPLATKLEQADLAIAQMSRTKRYAAKAAPWLAASSVGAGLGYLEWSLEMNKTHRLDPEQDLLNVAQMSLACDLSYRGLDLEDALNGKTPQDVDKAYAQLSPEAKAILAETEVLLDQFPRLDNLETADRLLARKLGHLPPAADFQALRKNLVEHMGVRADRSCQAVSLTHLKLKVTELSQMIEFVHQQLNPPAPEKK